MDYIKRIYTHFLRDSLYRNSMYLMLSTLILSFFGFFFWVINARLYTSTQVGLATTLISLCTLLSSFSLFGMNSALLRYLPQTQRKDDTVNTSLSIISLATAFVTIVYLLGIPFFSPKLTLLRESLSSAAAFILFMMMFVQNLLVENVFIAYRSSVFVLIKNTLLCIVKIILPVFLVGLGAYGIFFSYAAGTITALIFGLFFLVTKFAFKPKLLLDTGIVRNMARFSLGNYIAGFLITLPSLSLPILISNTLNYKSSAYFYVDMMIANLLYTIPAATAQSLFAEGSHDVSRLPFYLRKSLYMTVPLMLFAMIVTLISGNLILHAFGKEYANEGFHFLQILVVSGILLIVNYLFPTVLKIQHKLRLLIAINFIGAVIILFLSWFLIKNGLIGIGIAWIIGQAVMSVLYLASYFRK